MVMSSNQVKTTVGPFHCVIHTHDLIKRYGDTSAVNGLNLSIRKGEVYGFLGPNGAGKTTTMKVLLGLVKWTSGSANVLGCPTGSPAGLARIGAMVESPAFYPFLSGYDNLVVLARHANLAESVVTPAIESAGLKGRERDRFKTYSQGMKQRLGIAAVLMKNPDVLILDEPTNGLDPAGLSEMRALIRRLRDEGKAVLLSSHQLGEVEEVCDRVGIVFQGRLVKEGTLAELRGKGNLLIDATPLSKAQSHLADLYGADKVGVENDHIRLDVASESAALVNRQLLEAGIEVHEIKRQVSSLEEIFLTMNSEFSRRKGESNG